MTFIVIPDVRESTNGLVSGSQLVDVTAGGVAVAEDTAGMITFTVLAYPIRPYIIFPVEVTEEAEPAGERLLRGYARRFEQAFRPYAGADERPTFEPEDLPSG